MFQALHTAAHRSGVKAVKYSTHQFKPQGVTATAIIAESHITISTWPENGDAYVDFFSCKEDTDFEVAAAAICGVLRAKTFYYRVVNREPDESKMIPFICERTAGNG